MRYSEIVSEQNLNEMIVRHNNEDGDYLIAFRDSIWIVDLADIEDGGELWDEILSVIGEPDSNVDEIRDSRPDVLMGGYNTVDNTLSIDGGRETMQHPSTSRLIKKVAKQLGIENVYTSGYENDEVHYSPNDIKGKLPEYGYHGTSLKRLRQILKTGISAQSMGNWDDIHTKGAIFFSAEDDIPEFHANRTANNDDDIPVIIKFKLPDENKIFADYDVTASLLGSFSPHTDKAYQNSGSMSPRDSDIAKQHKRPQNLWKDMPVFGYKGRIPPKFFTEFYTTSAAPQEDDYDGAPFMILNRKDMNDYMKAYTYVADEFGDVQEVVNPNWLDYSSDEIIGELSGEEDED